MKKEFIRTILIFILLIAVVIYYERKLKECKENSGFFRPGVWIDSLVIKSTWPKSDTDDIKITNHKGDIITGKSVKNVYNK